uniref:Coiled-coil domain-containing protein 93 n=1 Tax=Ascaris lumbricoides TaxID=6252 RepID=A0A0M3HVB8_ASCLU
MDHELFACHISIMGVCCIPGARMVQDKRVFDVREDEEQFAKLQDTIDLLVAAGYFRARLKALPPFDRVIGGMVWCITLCNRSVDIDLFYSENSTIGQKIALTERVVEVLPQLKCPHSLEPHQIQGLDYIHIFPVVQWLVKQAVEAKLKRGDMVQNHATYQFGRRFHLPEDHQLRAQKVAHAKNYGKLKSLCFPLRVYRRVEGFVSKDLHEDIQCTLMEYGGRIFAEQSKQQPKESRRISEDRESIKEVVAKDVQECLPMEAVCSEKQRISTGALVHIIDTKALHEASTSISTATCVRHTDLDAVRSRLVEAEQELLKLRNEEKQIDAELLEANELSSSLQREIEDVERRIAAHLDFEQSIDKAFVSVYVLTSSSFSTQHLYDCIALQWLLEKLTQLTTEHDEMRKRESDFKAACNAELSRMQQELEELSVRRQERALSAGGASWDDEYRNAKERVEEARLQAALLNRQITLQQRRLDSVPSQVEISQYQRRIIELYNQMAAKHRETKQFYTLHNTLLDVKAYMQREIDLLNSIDDVQELTSKESYKESFIENLEQVLKGVDETLDKVTSKQKELQTIREQLSDDYQYLLDKERLYHKTVDDFKRVC